MCSHFAVRLQQHRTTGFDAHGRSGLLVEPLHQDGGASLLVQVAS
jgi:hypothetical protein